MPQIFVTGATGFIGSHLVKRLSEQGDAVRCLIRNPAKADELLALGRGIELVPGSLQQPHLYREALQDCDVVYHLAGLTSSLRARELWKVNAEGTHRLLQACAQNRQPPVVVSVSSLSAAGPWVERGGRRVGNTARPISNYGRSKLAGDLIAARLSERLPISIVRPGIVFGERNIETLPMFRSIYRTRMHAVPTFRPPRLSFIHQADLVDILLRVARQGQRLSDHRGAPLRDRVVPTACGVYFAGDPRTVSYAELGLLIGQAVGVSSPLMMHVPEPMLWVASTVNAYVSHLMGRLDAFNPDKIREAMAGDWIMEDSRLLEELDFHFTRSLEDRFQETARWYLSQGWL